MAKQLIAVFGASGVQGRHQVNELLRQGYRVRAITRNAAAYDRPEYRGVEILSADYDDDASLDAALAGVDAVFAQPFSGGDQKVLARQMASLGAAIKRAGTPLFIFNATMYGPRTPCGVPGFDVVMTMEQEFDRLGLPMIAFEPTLFMNNLLGGWIRDSIVKNSAFRYPHKPEMEADWICLEDLARFMVAALERPDLIGRKIQLGGPQRLKAVDVIAILSEALGRPIRHEYITPRQFAQDLWNLYHDAEAYDENAGTAPRGNDEKSFVDAMDAFYTFCNDAPQRPFLIDRAALQATMPMPTTSMREWALGQEWN